MEVFHVKSTTTAKGDRAEIRLVPLTPTHAQGDPRHGVRLATAPADRLTALAELFKHLATGGFNPTIVEHKGTKYLAIPDRMGQRMALGFVLSSLLRDDQEFVAVARNLAQEPDEIILYWFTLAFFGYRQKQARRALLTLIAPAKERTKKVSQ